MRFLLGTAWLPAFASGLYAKAKESFISQNPSIDLDTDTIKGKLISSSDYVPTYATDQFEDDCGTYGAGTGYNTVADQTLSNKTITGGVFDNTATITFSSVAIDGVKDATGVTIYKSTGTSSTSPLVCTLDFATAVTPNGGDIVVDWHTSGLFAL